MVNNFIVKQLPVLSPNKYVNDKNLAARISKHVLELAYTAYDLRSFAQDCGYHGPPFRWDEERRFLMRCELDATYFHLYGIARDDVDYIMDTFPIVRRKDEAAYGHYRTKRVILEIYDAMAEAMRSRGAGEQGGYQTRLNPPPGHPDAAHPWDEAYLGPELPRDQWWQEVEKDEGGGMKDEEAGSSESSSSLVREPQGGYEAKAKPAVLELRHPEPPKQKEQPAKSSASSQHPLLDVMPAPTGARPVRLKRAMALGKDKSPTATRELVAFLADEDGNIRWLASSSLLQRPTLDTVQAITAFLQHAEPERIAQARSEAIKVLQLFAETAESAPVREAANAQLGFSS